MRGVDVGELFDLIIVIEDGIENGFLTYNHRYGLGLYGRYKRWWYDSRPVFLQKSDVFPGDNSYE